LWSIAAVGCVAYRLKRPSAQTVSLSESRKHNLQGKRKKRRDNPSTVSSNDKERAAEQKKSKKKKKKKTVSKMKLLSFEDE